MIKAKYAIEIVGCDDQNDFEMELTEEELNLIKRFSELSHLHSNYNCQPKVNIKEIEF